MLRRFSLLAPSLALLAALLVVSPVLSALRGGTSGPDTLTGTSGNDQLTGKGDEDILRGLAGNDTYYFADGFSQRSNGSVGFDTLVEQSGQGSDTVSFKGVKTGQVVVYLQREWAQAGFSEFNRAFGPGGEVRFNYMNAGTLVQSSVEKAIGGQGNFDSISGGGVANILQPGGGEHDELLDYGGYNAAGSSLPRLPASNDVFKGFGDNTGTDSVADWGGTGDILDLRPFSTEDVYIEPVDFTSLTAGDESLQIVTGPTSQVVILGQFGPYFDSNQQGRIEKLIFADATITDTKTLSVAAAGTEELSSRQAELAEVAPRLAQEARALVDSNDRTGVKWPPGEGGPGAEIGPLKELGAGAKDKAKKDKQGKDKSAKHKKSKHNKQTKGTKAKKQDKQGQRNGLQRQIERWGQGGKR